METKVTKADIVTAIAEKQDVDVKKKDIALVVDYFLEEIKDALYANDHVELRRFGTFKVVLKKARPARNPFAKKSVWVPEHYAPKFKPSRMIKEEVKKAAENAEW